MYRQVDNSWMRKKDTGLVISYDEQIVWGLSCVDDGVTSSASVCVCVQQDTEDLFCVISLYSPVVKLCPA